jgi:hypothetical protein
MRVSASHTARGGLPLLARIGLAAAIACLLLAVAPGVSRAAYARRTAFQPRIRGALGLVPPVNRLGQLSTGDIASGALTPETYHGGAVMSGGVTVHTIFWAPPGHPFQGSPGAGIPTYEGLVKQFLGDVAADTGSSGTCTTADCNVFTIQRQYASGTALGQISPGSYQISYSAVTDSVDAADPYPGKAVQCASPAGAAVCLTDGQIQAEIDHVVQTTGGPRGLTNIWFVFLPPGVDECITADSCGTNSFAGYHAVSDVNGHGPTIYAVAIDPIIEAPVAAGADPQGYPDAEVVLDIAAHEVNEAISDPEGTGWMDPNGSEVGDKCDIGPQVGTPLGFAPNGSPYNQVINGHQYLLQEEWANVDSGGNADCVQSSATTSNQLPLPQVNLRQFNPVITGNVNRPDGGGIGVQVSLLRQGAGGGPVVVARASTTTASDGSWRVSLAPHAVGDDRDQITIDYAGANAPQPAHQVILTGNGGNPFTEAGWMGWTAMDEGSLATNAAGGSSLSLAPCFQDGTLEFTLGGAPAGESPNDLCNTQTDVATEGTSRIGRGDRLTWTSNDNRAFDAPTAPSPNLLGGLVSLTVPVGEPGSVSPFQSPLTTFSPGGFPACTADLEFQEVACTGLVPGQRYTLIDRRSRALGTADTSGTFVEPLRLRRGDSVSLSNGSRSLTTLHVARLRVRILGDETFLAGGSCQAGEYLGPPLTKPATNAFAGLPTDTTNPFIGGVALTGRICPPSGNAAGLPSTNISQTDELSGGVTETEVPDIQDTSPIDGETMHGSFTALAESGLALPNNELIPTDLVTRIRLTIFTPLGTRVLTIRNVDTFRGVPVPALVPGNYVAVWSLINFNGDTRFVATRFIEQQGRVGAGPRTRVRCTFIGGGRIRCVVTFPGNRQIRGSVRMRLTRGGALVALGHGAVRRGRAVMTMAQVMSGASGAWRATLVLKRPHIEPVTIRAAVQGL